MSRVETLQAIVNDQLLDVVVSIGHVEKNDSGEAYPASFIIRMDVEGEKFTEFLQGIMKQPGVVHVETLAAMDEVDE